LPESPDNLLAKQDESSVIHDFALGSLTYSEILGPLEVRGGEDAGILGSSLSQTFIIQATRDLRWQAFFFATIAFLTIALVGVLLSQWITRPIAQIVNAATAVSQGDFNTTIPIEGDDEITLIAQSFNNMLSGLREGAVYRDLLGRAITPEVRDLLREQLQAGKLRLEGQHALASVVYSDIRGFTTISEESGPARMFAYLNEYLDEVIPAITKESGVVNEFAGDALVAVFGVLPEALSPAESSYHACRAALGMAEAVEKMNDKRRLGGMPAFITGIGVTTGQVVTGAVGSADRLHFSVVGDPVNAAHRLQELNKKFNATGVIISEDTWQALGDKQSEFHIQPLGTIQLRGKETPLATYRLFYA
jgi:adenylate cyclase